VLITVPFNVVTCA